MVVPSLWYCENEFAIETIVKMENSQNNIAETFKITGNWENQSKELKGKYSQPSDADLKIETGLERLKRVEARLYNTREEVINIIKKSQPTTVVLKLVN